MDPVAVGKVDGIEATGRLLASSTQPRGPPATIFLVPLVLKVAPCEALADSQSRFPAPHAKVRAAMCSSMSAASRSGAWALRARSNMPGGPLL